MRLRRGERGLLVFTLFRIEPRRECGRQIARGVENGDDLNSIRLDPVDNHIGPRREAA